jgi:hypothetical protein
VQVFGYQRGAVNLAHGCFGKVLQLKVIQIQCIPTAKSRVVWKKNTHILNGKI